MSNREKCLSILDGLTEEQLFRIAFLLEEARDDLFCEELHREYEADPDKDVFLTEEEVCRELGIVA